MSSKKSVMKNRYKTVVLQIRTSVFCKSIAKSNRADFGRQKKTSFLDFHLGEGELTKVLQKKMVMVFVLYFLVFLSGVRAWTGEIHGRVICDVCGDSSIGPEDHILEGAEVAVLCITKSGEVLNYQAFTDSKGTYTVAETMPQSDRWDVCLARPIGSFHQHCTSHHRDAKAGVKFSYNHPSGYSHTVRPFLYQPAKVPTYCI